MAVPKKKTSKAKGRSRRASAWPIRQSARSVCPRCGSVKRPHRICSNCGWYAGRQVIDVD
ncbi:MAG: 50S ribosomal protein L32 [Actinomycetota bacterium]|nr:50S ribosomal protein L32 [Actinomycetota bacterium]MED5276545.1 50S ribosomal protein L32 [Actinomycetota bacterium]